MFNRLLVAVYVICCLGVSLSNAKCGQLLVEVQTVLILLKVVNQRIVLDNIVRKTDKNAIVDTHNYLRSLVSQGKIPNQPPAKNLRFMTWDDKLAREAQKIANTCIFDHVDVYDGNQVGQNIGWTGSTQKSNGQEWAHIIESWFNEHKSFIYPNKSSNVTGHYTQVVWADTYLVGCGFAFYKDNTSGYNKLYVCNYAPAGNDAGVPPYKI